MKKPLCALLGLFLALVFGIAAAGPIEDLQPGHWAAISLNTVQSLDPCPGRTCPYSLNEGQSGVMNDWCGGAFATGFGSMGGLVVWGGGHNGYGGNELYVFNLATRLWERYTEPSNYSASSCNGSTGAYPDGAPCPPHTYAYLGYQPKTNSFVTLSVTPNPVGYNCLNIPYLFSFGTKKWKAGAQRNFGTGGDCTGASSAYDPTRDVFWMVPSYGSNFCKYDPNANTWTNYGSYDPGWAVPAVDPILDLFVTPAGGGVNAVKVKDLSNPSAAAVTVTTIGDQTLLNAGYKGFDWDPVSGKFVGWVSGGDVYTLTLPATNWRTAAWVWEKISPAPDNTVTPTAPNSNGTYGRWRYAPNVNAFVVVNKTTDAVYMYKLTGGLEAEARARALRRDAIKVNPNPFGRRTTIVLPEGIGSSWTAGIYNARGMAVREWAGPAANRSSLVFEPSGNSAGVYFIRIVCNGRTYSKRLVRL